MVEFSELPTYTQILLGLIDLWLATGALKQGIEVYVYVKYRKSLQVTWEEKGSDRVSGAVVR